ncbi:hypothetical protein JTB14_003591 [Gonioctena quinquepunctata]|nr:hypothetical protein JTB14_003591 [Gonioctena quinquepunctata]
MDTRKPLHDNELADILTSEDFWADEEITIEDEAGPSSSQYSEDDKWVPEKDGNCRAYTEYSGSENENSDEQNFGIDDDIEETMGRRFFYGILNEKTAKPCMKWAQRAPVRGREWAENIHTILPGLKGPARENPPSESPLQAWRLIFSDDILAEIVKNTNKKIGVLADSNANAGVYTGEEINEQPKSSKQFKEKSLSHPTQVVMRITEPFYHSKRNLTADNWYTSIEAARMLKEKGLTFVGTMKKNKREISAAFLPSKAREVGVNSRVAYQFEKHGKEISRYNYLKELAINTSTQESTIISFRAKFATEQRIFLESNSRIAREPKKLRETKEGRDVASAPRRKTQKLAMFVEHVKNQYVSNAAVPCVQTV